RGCRTDILRIIDGLRQVATERGSDRQRVWVAALIGDRLDRCCRVVPPDYDDVEVAHDLRGGEGDVYRGPSRLRGGIIALHVGDGWRSHQTSRIQPASDRCDGQKQNVCGLVMCKTATQVQLVQDSALY